MTIQVIIKSINDSFPLTIESIADHFFLEYGSCDANYCLTREMISSFYTLYDPNCIGRGIEAYIEDNQLVLTISIPSTIYEIELFYDLIFYVCQKVGVETCLRNQEVVHYQELYQFVEEDKQASIIYLEEIDEAIEEYGFIYLYAVKNQICFGKKELAYCGNSLQRFEQLFHNLQKDQYTYATAMVLETDDHKYIAAYQIKEDEPFVIPIHPEIFYDPNCQLSAFYFSPYYTFIPFDIFIDHLSNATYYDSNHVMVTFEKMELFKLIEQFDTKLFEESDSYGAYGRIIDSGFLHSEKIETFNFDLDELCGFYHIAIYLLWCYHHQLLDLQFIEDCNLKQAIEDENIDFCKYFRDHPKMQGDLQENYFNELGKQFTNHYYVFLKEGYPNDVDQTALKILGKSKYHAKQYHDEAYLFVSYDDYLEPLNKCIEQAFNEFIKNQS